MKYLVKRTKISERVVEKLMIPCGDPSPEKEVNLAGQEKEIVWK